MSKQEIVNQSQLQFLTGQLTTEFLGGTRAGNVNGPAGPVLSIGTGTPCCVSRSGLCTAGCIS